MLNYRLDVNETLLTWPYIVYVAYCIVKADLKDYNHSAFNGELRKVDIFHSSSQLTFYNTFVRNGNFFLFLVRYHIV